MTAARFRRPGHGVEGFRLEGIDGRVLGCVEAVGHADADLLVDPAGADTRDGALRRLDWNEIVWIDPVRRALLVSGSGSTTLVTDDRRTASDAAPRKRRKRKPARTIATLAAGTLTVLASAALVGVTGPFSPHETLYTIAAAVIAAAAFVLVQRPER